MLPRQSRLTDKYHYNLVRKFGKAFHSNFYIFSILKDKKDTDHLARIGIIITNKVDSRSTERHRIKRITSELLKPAFSNFPKGFLVVVVVKTAAKGKTYEELSADFNFVLSKVSFA